MEGKGREGGRTGGTEGTTVSSTPSDDVEREDGETVAGSDVYYGRGDHFVP